MPVKPSLPKGTRDMLPETMLRREYIIEVIRLVFRTYGFLPIETPAMENLSTLTGKYGEEGDRLIFKLLRSGDFLNHADEKALAERNSQAVTSSISNKALRYDLTVPFARFVVQNQNELSFPFKRYQIQPVWRADRPQKGRYTEFYQCDADAVGSDSLLLELDFIRMYQKVFQELNLPVRIKINHRKVLAGIAEGLSVEERLGEFTVILDKLDKIGIEGVESELARKNFAGEVIQGVKRMAALTGDTQDQLQAIEDIMQSSAVGKEGLQELKYILDHSDGEAPVAIDLTLARGLDYYTGTILEVSVPEIAIGSVGGGGRYDDLTAIFGLKGLSGVGISFGLDRIYLAMEELDLFPPLEAENTEVLFVNFGSEEALFSLRLANELRDQGIKTEVYPDPAKLRKQMDFANRKNIATVVLIGSEEMKQGKFTVKDMRNGTQKSLSRMELLQHFSTPDTIDYGAH